jgi:hypothetical protein
MRKRRLDSCLGPRFHVRIAWLLPAASRCPARIRPLALPVARRSVAGSSISPPLLCPPLLHELTSAVTDRDPVLFFFCRAVAWGRRVRHRGGDGGGSVGEMVAVARGRRGSQLITVSASLPHQQCPRPRPWSRLRERRRYSGVGISLPVVDQPPARITSSASRCSGVGRQSSPPPPPRVGSSHLQERRESRPIYKMPRGK